MRTGIATGDIHSDQFHFGSPPNNAGYAQIKSAGFEFIRWDLFWINIEPTKGVYSLDAEKLNQLKQGKLAGLKNCVIVGARPNGSGSPSGYTDPFDPVAFPAAVAWMVQSYGPVGTITPGLVDVIEVLNEPNTGDQQFPGFSGATATVAAEQALVALNNAMADAVHAVSPATPVIGLGTQGQTILDMVAMPLRLDGIVFHPNGSTDPSNTFEPPFSDFEAFIQAVKAATTIPIWLTEIDRNVNDAYQDAGYLCIHAMMSLGNGVAVWMPYGWTFNADATPNSQQMVQWTNLDPRIGYYAMKRLFGPNGLLIGATAAGKPTITGGDANSKGYVFNTAANTLCGIWEGNTTLGYLTKTDLQVSVSFPTALTNVAGSYVLNMISGEMAPITASLSNGVATVQTDISTEPHLIVLAPGSTPPPPQQVTVPNLVGMTESAADSAITSAGLSVGTDVSASSSSVPAGSVISQSPVASTMVAPGSAVVLTISSGPPLPPPSTIYWGPITNSYGGSLTAGANLDVAAPLNQKAGDSIVVNVSAPVAVSKVIDSASGSQASAFSKITTASGATETWQATNISGLTWKNTIHVQFVAAALNPKITVTEWIPGGQPPPPPSSSVTVPNVVGLSQSAGSSAITGAGLIVGTVTQSASSTVASGNIISQQPVASTSVASGSAVALTVSSGPPPPPPPSGTVPGTPTPKSASGIIPTGNVSIGSRTLQFYADFTDPSYANVNQFISLDSGTSNTIWYALAGQPGGMNTKFNGTEGDPFSTAQGYLTIHANGTGTPPYGGMISTVAHSFNEPPGTVIRGFWATNAYWEVKALVPAQGSERWMSAWVLGSTAHIDPATNGYGEVDILEFPFCSQNLHFYPVDPVTHKVTANQQPGTNQPPVPSLGWHVWGCLIDFINGASVITIYIDGVLSHQFTGLTSAWNVPLQMLLDNSFGTGFPSVGNPGWTNDFGIQYVRCWS